MKLYTFQIHVVPAGGCVLVIVLSLLVCVLCSHSSICPTPYAASYDRHNIRNVTRNPFAVPFNINPYACSLSRSARELTLSTRAIKRKWLTSRRRRRRRRRQTKTNTATAQHTSASSQQSAAFSTALVCVVCFPVHKKVQRTQTDTHEHAHHRRTY